MILQDDHDLTRSYKILQDDHDLTRSYKILQDYISQNLTRSRLHLTRLHLTRLYKILQDLTRSRIILLVRPYKIL